MVHAYEVFIASGFSTSTLVNREVNAPRHYLRTKSGEIASNFSRNEIEKKTQFTGTRTHDLKLRRFTWIPTRPPHVRVSRHADRKLRPCLPMSLHR